MEGKKRIYANERDALMECALISEIAESVSHTLEGRCKLIKRGKSVLGLMKWAGQWLLTEMIKTIPAEQQQSFKHNLMSMSYRLGVKGPVKDNHRDEWGLWMSFEGLEALSEAAKAQCLTCDLKDCRERECPLRKCFDDLGAEVNRDGKGCPYRWL